MVAVRRWSVRHARGLEIFYAAFERVLVALHPVFKAVGYQRLEAPVAAVEKVVKGFLFSMQDSFLRSLINSRLSSRGILLSFKAVT